MLLAGINALVTGSSRGIGRAIALRFAAEGANVVVHYLNNEEEAADVVTEIRALGARAELVRGDIADSKRVREIAAFADSAFGGIDVLVNNAGRGLTKPFSEISEEEWDRIIAVHMRGVFLMTQLLGDGMRRRKRGSIINISSVASRSALPLRVIYSSVEAAKNMFTQALACEWASDGVRINCIAPGTILTPLVQENFEKGLLDGESVLERTPLGRFGNPEEIAAVAAFLASRESSYVTGQTIFADGGWTSWGGWRLRPQKEKH
jgi:NAD(P)-dependent dehydrogenase (short-subunit alcohol dehydrogenase family)